MTIRDDDDDDDDLLFFFGFGVDLDDLCSLEVVVCRCSFCDESDDTDATSSALLLLPPPRIGNILSIVVDVSHIECCCRTRQQFRMLCDSW